MAPTSRTTRKSPTCRTIQLWSAGFEKPLIFGTDARVYGRNNDEWKRIVDDAVTFLTEQAWSKHITSYSDLNSALAHQGHISFNFGMERGHAAVGVVLGETLKRTIDESGVVLSAIVSYVGQNDPGPGFYSFANQLGLLPDTATADERLAFWARQVEAVHKRYARPARRARHD